MWSTKLLKLFAFTAALTLSALPSFGFEIAFDWAGLKSCTGGHPNVVANPRIVLTDVPAGSKFIRFKLVHLNAPDFNHGGGTVAYTGQSVIERGAFK